MNTLDELLTKIKETPLALIYLSQPTCSVCLADKPRLNKLALEKQVPLYAVDVAEVPEAAGQFSALTAPVVLLYFQGDERHREARIIDFNRLAAIIDRYRTALTKTETISYDDLFDQLME
ncbi:thioredoxin [Enterococcus gallinarum]|nr:thioredoxin [Enterococcus gallinarum]